MSSTPRRLPFEGVPSEVERTSREAAARRAATSAPSPSPIPAVELPEHLFRDELARPVAPAAAAPVVPATAAEVEPPAAAATAVPPPAAPARRRRNPWLVALAVLLPLLLIAAGAGAFWWFTQRDTPEKAIRGYLTALAEGDADRALTYADASLDGTFLTDDVLAQLKSQGAGVGGLVEQSKNAATFTLAGTPVSVTYPTSEANGVVRLPVAVRATVRTTVPVTLLGKPVSGDVWLFPGRYQLVAGSPNLKVDQQVLAVDPSQPITVTPSVALSPAGVDAARAAVAKDLQRCLAAKQLAPANCPFQLKQAANGTINESSITYTLEAENPVPTAQVAWDPATSRAKSSFALKIRIKASGALNDGSGTGEVSQVLDLNRSVYVDVTKATPVVTWG